MLVISPCDILQRQSRDWAMDLSASIAGMHISIKHPVLINTGFAHSFIRYEVSSLKWAITSESIYGLVSKFNCICGRPWPVHMSMGRLRSRSFA